MGGVELLQAVSGGLYLLAISVVGFRLLALAKRNRALPELYLGLSLVLGGCLGASLEAGAMVAAETLETAPLGMMMAVGKAFGLLGQGIQAVFVWRVFRPNARWALGLVALLWFVNLSTYAAFGFSGTFVTGAIPHGLFLVEFLARISASIWLTIEAFRYYRLMRRRRDLGLADAIVTNRFLLWSLAGLSALVMLSTSVPPVFFADSENPLMLLDLVVFSAAGIVTSFLYLLTFFPPPAYRRWLVGSEEGRA
ncbi:MAG: hypothetical protein CL910_05335 [Deltaproteobacteria bacterium]|jgi:hypothetical protein|nr:hypothetical protein [Deltaproteobacteria bacterium]